MKATRVKKTIIIGLRVEGILVPWGRNKVISVRVSSLIIASRSLAKGVHLILMLLRVDVVSLPILEVHIFLLVRKPTNQWHVLKSQLGDLVGVWPCLSLPWGMPVDLT